MSITTSVVHIIVILAKYAGFFILILGICCFIGCAASKLSISINKVGKMILVGVFLLCISDYAEFRIIEYEHQWLHRQEENAVHEAVLKAQSMDLIPASADTTEISEN